MLQIPATIGLIVINLVVFVLMTAAQSGEWSGNFLVSWGGNAGRLTLDGELWRVVTAMFLHGGVGHLAGNLVCLLAWGSAAEQAIGTVRFVPAYFAFGILAGFASALAHPEVVSVGASGAIAGTLGLLVVMWLRGDARISASGLVTNIALNAGISLLPSVDWVAHVAGFAAGLALGPLLFPVSFVLKAEDLPAPVPDQSAVPPRAPPPRLSFREPMDFPQGTVVYRARAGLVAILADGTLVADDPTAGTMFETAADYRQHKRDDSQWDLVREF